MAVANLINGVTNAVGSRDSIVIVDNFQSIRGGRTLDVTGFAADEIEAGHVIIKDSNGENYKPMPVTGESYAALPVDHEVAGILVATIREDKPLAGIMVRGTVNENAAKYAYPEAVKTALEPLVVFTHDKA